MRQLSICIFVISLAYAEIIHVPEDYLTIQSAIDAATYGDEIIVSPGLYQETINFSGKSIVVRSQFADSGDINIIIDTIIDGNHQGSVVEFVSGETNSSELNGFTIQNGYVGGDGGGIFTTSNPTLKNLIIRDNIAGSGGGIGCQEADPVIENVYLFHNTADHAGGGISIHYNGNPEIRNVVIANNSSDMGGGADIQSNSIQSFENVVFSGNTATRGGACTVYLADNFEFNNCVITENTASFSGSGLYIGHESNVIIQNSILWRNGDYSVELIPDGLESQVNILYSNLESGENGTAENENGIISFGDGIINDNPMWVDPMLLNYQLYPLSPCIDTGNPDSGFNDCPDGGMGSEVNDMGIWGGPGACEWLLDILPGCVDIEAINYQPAANLDDGSCVYISPPANPYAVGGESQIHISWDQPPANVREDGHLWISNVTSEHIEISYSTTVDVFGFQFLIVPDDLFNQVWVGATGGMVSEVGLNVTINPSGQVLIFQFGQTASIPPGTGVLTYVQWQHSAGAVGEIDLDIVAIAGQGGNALDFGILEPYLYDSNIVIPSNTYNLYRDGVMIATGINSQYYVDDMLPYPVTHCYTVSAVQDGFESEVSETVCAETTSTCLDPDACNYNPDADEEGFCEYETCIGCMDDTAVNFNPYAIEDDGSCVYLTVPESVEASDTEEGTIVSWEYPSRLAPRNDASIWISQITSSSIELSYNSNVSISAVQFTIAPEEQLDPQFLSFSGGVLEDSGFIMAIGDSGICLSYSMTGSSVPAGQGILGIVEWSPQEIGGYVDLHDPLFVDGDGGSMDVELGDQIYYNPGEENSFQFNLYRDGEMIAEGLEETHFLDVWIFSNAEHCYTVTVFDGTFESQHSNESCTLSIEDSVDSPEFFQILSIYPNPFNPSTQISFQVVSRGQVLISIFDIQGRVVHTADLGLISPGNHVYQWRPEKVASGVFFIRVSLNENSSTQKVIYLR